MSIASEISSINSAKTLLARALIDTIGIPEKDILNSDGTIKVSGLYNSNNQLKKLLDWSVLVNSTNLTFLPLGGGTMLDASSIIFPGSTTEGTSLSTTTNFGIAYGRIQGQGTIAINADTDDSGTEYVLLTAGHGVSNSATDGLAVGADSLTWKNNTIYHSDNLNTGTAGYALLLACLDNAVNCPTDKTWHWNPWNKPSPNWVYVQNYQNTSINNDWAAIELYLSKVGTNGLCLNLNIDGSINTDDNGFFGGKVQIGIGANLGKSAVSTNSNLFVNGSAQFTDSILFSGNSAFYHYNSDLTSLYFYAGHDGRGTFSHLYNGQSGKSIRLYDAGGTAILDTVTIGNSATTAEQLHIIYGKLVVNPAYSNTSNSYNEGIRVNLASNGWAEVTLGGTSDTNSSTSANPWVIGRRGSAGTYGAVGDLAIECSTGNGLTVYAGGGANLVGSLYVTDNIKFRTAFTQNTAPTCVTTFISNDSANGLTFTTTSNLSVGNATTVGGLGISKIVREGSYGKTITNSVAWINNAVDSNEMGGITSWTGNFIAFGGWENRHKSQLLVSKTRFLYRTCYGDADNLGWQEVLNLSGGTMTGAIKWSTASGNNKSSNYIDCGGGYSSGSGYNGIKVGVCHQSDAFSGLGQDLSGLGGYDFSIVGCAYPDSSTYGGYCYISFNKHNKESSSYQWLGYWDGSGNLTARGSFYANSDIRYKNVNEYKVFNIQDLASLPIFTYTWKKDINIDSCIGTSALSVEVFIPELIHETEKGFKLLNYATLGTIAGITACKELVKHEAELNTLKQRVKELEAKLNKYEYRNNNGSSN